jgi:hypothetical protein
MRKGKARQGKIRKSKVSHSTHPSCLQIHVSSSGLTQSLHRFHMTVLRCEDEWCVIILEKEGKIMLKSFTKEMNNLVTIYSLQWYCESEILKL